MSEQSTLSVVKQLLESAERNVAQAKSLLMDMEGGEETISTERAFEERLSGLSTPDSGRVVEGVFDGEHMVGADKRIYPVPANYASKSKLVEGDTLKLTIADDGSFIYKQIGPMERKKVMGELVREESGQYRVRVDSGKVYKVLLASVTYFKADEGDEITLVVPREGTAEWGAVENVIKKAPQVGDADGAVITRGEVELDEDGDDDTGLDDLGDDAGTLGL